MKRYGDELIDEICSDENIRKSIHTVIRGKKRKNTRIGRIILKYEDKYVKAIAKKIRSNRFRVHQYREMLVTDGPKVRRVQSVPIVDRIACNAVMSVVEEKVWRKYIRTTSASIKRRGAKDLLEIIKRDLRQHPENFRFAYKSDYKKFYESVDQDFMMYSLRRMFKGKILMGMFENFVRMMPSGISIGLRSSQGFGNMMLSLHLDHYVKDRLGWKYYYRYCDDVMAAGASKEQMWKFRDMMHEKADFMRLTIKPDERVFPVENGVDALGYVIYPDIIKLRKRNKQNFARRIKRKSSKRRRNELTASFYSLCKHGNCKNIFYKLTGVKMKDFKDLKIKPKYQDNKKRFNARYVKIGSLQGKKVVILDFETGVMTKWQKLEYETAVKDAKARLNTLHQKYGDNIPDTEEYVKPEDIKKPEGRYVVHVEQPTGEKVKFFTGDRELWSCLDQAKEIGEIPFRTDITCDDNGKFHFS